MQSSFVDVFGGQGLQVVALDPDADDIANFPAVVDYVNFLGPLTYPVGIETSFNYAPIAATYEGSNPFPIDILVGKDGTIRYIAREYDPQAMLELIPALLAE
ncbi:MAG: hypothetical protein ABMA64_31985 [Myxococcota bacterium]